ncbi:MAG: endonuclease V [Desulfobacterota bacterium]|nr:endonuclease V [Thermodesulfobacteriota bacterium]MDW8001706.1 endonuclease V [Deltaproteobacteria bacterium]
MKIFSGKFEKLRKIQLFFGKKANPSFNLMSINFVCGLDASYSDKYIYAVASVFRFKDLVPVESSLYKTSIDFPYIPGFLSFREGKALLKAISKLKLKPDVLIVDGHGLAHPRSAGIATYVGVITGIPSLGCAKSILIGEFRPPEKVRGFFTPIYFKERIIGLALVTKNDTKPLFVSPGYKIDIHSSMDIVLKCSRGYRTPEPLRLAHMLSKKFRDLDKNLDSGSRLPSLLQSSPSF